MRETLEKIKSELNILEYWFSAVYHDEKQVERVRRLEKICDDARVDVIEQSLCEVEEETEFQKARRIMRQTLIFEDEELYRSYQANVAMLLLDEQERNNDKDLVWKKGQLIDFTIPLNRNKLADKILKLIFLGKH